jgi:hypothetical protein
MKSNISSRHIKVLISILLFFALSLPAFSQQPPPPPPPNGGPNSGHGLGGNQGAPAAPIGSGLEILIILGAFYSGKKIYTLHSANPE